MSKILILIIVSGSMIIRDAYFSFSTLFLSVLSNQSTKKQVNRVAQSMELESVFLESNLVLSLKDVGLK